MRSSSAWARHSDIARLIALFVLAATWGTTAGADVIDRVLATVEGRVITLSDVRIVKTLGLVPVPDGADPDKTMLNALIDRLLILEEVERYAPPEPEAGAIEQRVEAVRARFASADEFTRALERLGTNAVFVSQWARNDLRIASYLDQRFAGAAEPNQDELENYRRQHASEFARPGQQTDEVQLLNEARARVMAERRQALVKEWIDGLRARSDVSVTVPH
jgi:hypothetical protein